ncbi:GNAT family N-acetyltransferase [Phytoactinopolyspora halotolerans]|uniref:GNAT family N-acetyltransferase n=1 Tax=Phytoactinopolyspora halotolerans TaxID=1981512 RepID=A0A6L9S0K1_9ACTN|nr:GNAT family N-acetyltransferase [Phytoactinopolyspora halotolerans]NED98974.1 GNAT family N-acetyltransferase [Phytoactinopolyspora halotolerans]
MIWTVQTALGRLTLREQIEPDDEPGLLALFAECDDWFEATTGGPSGPGDVQSLFYSLPEGASLDDKHLFTLRDDERIVGLIDVVARYPDPRSCAVGTFLIAPSHRRAGVAKAVAQVLLAEAREFGFKQVTAPVVDVWPAGARFAEAIGFEIGDVASPTTNRHTGRHESSVRRAILNLDAPAG